MRMWSESYPQAKHAYIYHWSFPTQTQNICLKNRHLSYIHIQVTCCWRAFIHWQAAIELLDERDTRYMSPDLSTQWMAARKAARTAEKRHKPEEGSRSRSPGGRKRESKRSDRSSWHSRSALARFFAGATKREKSEGRRFVAHSRGSRADVPRRVPPYNFDLQPRKESNMAVPRRAYSVVNNATSSSWENFLTLSPLLFFLRSLFILFWA